LARKKERRRKKEETTGRKYNGLLYSIGRAGGHNNNVPILYHFRYSGQKSQHFPTPGVFGALIKDDSIRISQTSLQRTN